MDKRVTEQAVLLQNRFFLYSFATRAFSKAADPAFFELTLCEQTKRELSLLDDAAGRGTELWKRLATTINSGTSSATAEYERLFIGPAKPLVYIWESVYVSGEPLLFQGCTLEVREAYREFGLRAEGYPHEADDHLATELGFMAELARRSLAAFDERESDRFLKLLEAQFRFLEEHLLRWIGEFSHRLDEVDGISSFYPLFASLATLICERDAEVIQELLAAA